VRSERASERSSSRVVVPTSPAAGGVRGVPPRQPEILPASAKEGRHSHLHSLHSHPVPPRPTPSLPTLPTPGS
jgi:hypothetical protein